MKTFTSWPLAGNVWPGLEERNFAKEKSVRPRVRGKSLTCYQVGDLGLTGPGHSVHPGLYSPSIRVSSALTQSPGESNTIITF